MKCFKCGTKEGKIVKHHIKYNPEIVVDCCWKCHQAIHKRVRKNNECSLTPKEAHRLSCISSAKRNCEPNRIKLAFDETILPYVQLIEQLRYHKNTGNINWNVHFHATNGKKLLYIDC